MEFIWSPWRYDYIASAGKKTSSCVFCIGDDQTQDADRLVLFRGASNFIILNLFPYTSGHLMIAPFEHLASVVAAAPAQTTEMMELTKRAISALTDVYHPEGFNVGMNLGQVAGAGVRDHFHLHVVPRWAGDANFMSITGETRVLPEELTTTYQRLKQALLGAFHLTPSNLKNSQIKL
jgi:ATP adenylyltransferase